MSQYRKTSDWTAGQRVSWHDLDMDWLRSAQERATMDAMNAALRPAKPAPIPTGVEKLQEQCANLEAERDHARADLRRVKGELERVKAQLLNAQAVRAVPSDSAVAERIGKLIAEFHPDRHGGHALANRITAALNGLRDYARGKR